MRIEYYELDVWRGVYFLMSEYHVPAKSYEDTKGISDALYARLIGWDNEDEDICNCDGCEKSRRR